MKLAAHITFFDSPLRKQFLEEVIEGLLNLNCKTDIYVYTNRVQKELESRENIKIHLCPYRNYKISKLPKKAFLEALRLKFLIHPFYLSWEHRKVIEEVIDDYDIQLYLEDDIAFKQENLNYWMKYKDITVGHNYNLGFLRIEKDKDHNQFLTDVTWPLKDIIEIDGQKFLLNNLNPYCGFWIYDREELRKFVLTKEWHFRFNSYGIREKAAVGRHAQNMNYYKGTVIPLTHTKNGLITPSSSSVHHLPNNYIGKGYYCTQSFPITI